MSNSTLACSCRRLLHMTDAGLGAFLVFAACVPLFSAQAVAQEESHPKAVLELFTSQGCSSCPPADELLAKLAARPDIIALSFSVNYWDYIGWKDTLATPENVERQRSYAKRKPGGDGRLYTPQMIVNGMACSAGHKAEKIEAEIARTNALLASERVPLKGEISDAALSVETGDAPSAKRASGTLWLATVSKSVGVAIERGENAGRRITYVNAVRKLRSLGKWTGKTQQFRAPAGELSQRPSDFFVALLQADDGAIIGATEIKR